MKRALFYGLLFFSLRLNAQPDPLPKESFLNAIAKQIIPGKPSRFCLLLRAAPCSFNKYNYDEWVKYGLKEDIGFQVLNELAKKASADNAPANWQQERLPGAYCIDSAEARKILARPGNKCTRRKWRRWQKQLNAGEGLVYSFSKPEFTNDNHYAVIDMSCRCDAVACGLGVTYLFRRDAGGWVIAGELMRWGN